MYYKLLSSITLLLFSYLSFAQTGPAGVGTNDGTSNLVMWYRSDNGIANSGTNISQWSNSAGYTAHTMNQSGSSNPQLISNSLNGYDEIRFNASGILQTGSNLTTANFITNQASSFIIAKANTITSSWPYSTLPHQAQRFSCHIPWSNSIVYYDIGTCCSASARIQVGGESSLTSYSQWSYDANPSSGKQLYRDGRLLQSRNNTSTYSAHASHTFGLGDNFNGNMTEVIIFNAKVNTAQRLIVQNYLSAKYNIALSNDDLYTQDNAGNGNFDHDVAGIGQATDGTNHTDSRGTGIVRMNTPSALSNGDYLFWGEETKDPSYSFVSSTTNYTEQLNSKWRVSKVNNLGTVTVAFDITGMDLSGKQSCQPLQIVVANNFDFLSATAYDLTIVGNTATATGVSFSDGDYFTLRYLDQIVWDGTTFFNGAGAGNAPDNTNECLKLTVKAGANGVLTFDAHVREVEIENGAVLQVSDGFLLEVENQVEINGEIDLLGEAQLIQNHTNTTSNSGTGFLKLRQQGTSNTYNYNYWSAPVNTSGSWQIGNLEDANGVVNFHAAFDANPSTTPITLSNRWLYDFNAVSGEYAGWNFLSPTSTLTPGRGYTMKGSGASGTEQEYIFKGIPNDGNYSYVVNAGNDFLVGNPYPSSLDADQFINDNLAVIDGTLYFWEHFTTNPGHSTADYEGGYATYNLMMSLPAVADDSGLTSGEGSASKPKPTNRIAVGQGFFVTIDNAGSIVFNNEQRKFAKESLSETIFYRTADATTETDTRTKVWISFKDPNAHTRIIGLGYDSNASYDYDKAYDAMAYDNQLNEIFWKQGTNKLHIQALSAPNENDVLPLEVKITNDGDYTFAIDEIQNFPSSMDIFLKDNEQNLLYDLKAGAVTLPLTEGTYENTFSIVFRQGNALSTTDFESNEFYLIYHNEQQQLELKHTETTQQITEYTIYNSIGQQLYNAEPEEKYIDIAMLSSGVYILNISFENGISTAIKFVK